MSRAIDYFDIAKGGRSLADALRDVQARFLVMGFSSDWLHPPYQLKEIASALGVGVRTIETHRERIMRRLDIHSVAGLTRYAVATGLISLEVGESAPSKPGIRNR